jgi:AcrR family transcriptional regulator
MTEVIENARESSNLVDAAAGAAAEPADPQIEPSTRERILDVALDAFVELGFDGASTRTIATRAGVNQGLIPYYFGTKEVLWQEAVNRAFARLEQGIQREALSTEDLSDRERLAILIRRFVGFVAVHPEFLRLMHDEGKRDGPRMHWLVDHHVRPLFEELTGLFSRAQVSGGLQQSLGALHFHYIFVGAVGTIFHQAPECRRLSGLDPASPEVSEAHADALIQLFLGDASLGKQPR